MDIFNELKMTEKLFQNNIFKYFYTFFFYQKKVKNKMGYTPEVLAKMK